MASTKTSPGIKNFLRLNETVISLEISPLIFFSPVLISGSFKSREASSANNSSVFWYYPALHFFSESLCLLIFITFFYTFPFVLEIISHVSTETQRLGDLLDTFLEK